MYLPVRTICKLSANIVQIYVCGMLFFSFARKNADSFIFNSANMQGNYIFSFAQYYLPL